MPIRLPDLPYTKEALQPHMSAETLDFHHGKHHQAYVTKLNDLIQISDLAQEDLNTIIQKTKNQPNKAAIFNNAAQIYNHTFFWESLAAQGGGTIKDGPLLKALTLRFGSIESFLEIFHKAACGQFGSGWAWVVAAPSGDIDIVTTGNAQIPEGTPLITCDVWEHAYYIDHRNRRPDYVRTFLNHLAHWSFMEDNLRAA